MGAHTGLPWVMTLKQEIEKTLSRQGVPEGDLRWLLTRCDDTLSWPEDWSDWQEASTRQLAKDVLDFNEEFPGILSDDVLPPTPG